MGVRLVIPLAPGSGVSGVPLERLRNIENKGFQKARKKLWKSGANNPMYIKFKQKAIPMKFDPAVWARRRITNNTQKGAQNKFKKQLKNNWNGVHQTEHVTIWFNCVFTIESLFFCFLVESSLGHVRGPRSSPIMGLILSTNLLSILFVIYFKEKTLWAAFGVRIRGKLLRFPF